MGGNGGGQAAQAQGGCLGQGVGRSALGAKSALEHEGVALNGVVTGHRHDHTAKDEGGGHGNEQGEQVAHVFAKLHASASFRPPVM